MRDRESQEAFVRGAYAGLFGWFRRLCGSDDLAADLTQESFTAFWAAAGHAGEGVSPRTWLYAIGRNLWRKHLRDRKCHDSAPLALVEEGGPAPGSAAEGSEFRDAAETAVGGLPTDLREVFTLRFWHRFGYDEIGSIQGVSADLARWRHFEARRRLRRALGAWDPDRERDEEDLYA